MICAVVSAHIVTYLDNSNIPCKLIIDKLTVRSWHESEKHIVKNVFGVWLILSLYLQIPLVICIIQDPPRLPGYLQKSKVQG